MKLMKILLLFIIPSLALADGYNFVVENTAMVDTYFNIFNAIASLFKSEDYVELLRLVFLLGGFFVFAGGVLSSGESGGSGKILAPYIKYTLTGTAILVLMFSNQEKMWITTNNIPSMCSTASVTTGTAVDNMPAVLAYFFTVTNRIGTNLTHLAEAGFNTPASSIGTATMSDSGGYLGSLKQTIKLLAINPNKITNNKDDELDLLAAEGNLDFLSMWQNFFAKCVYEVAQNKGLTGDAVLNTLKNSNDIETWVKNYLADNPYKDITSYAPKDNLIQINGEHTTCGAYHTQLEKINSVLKNKTACTLPLAHGGVVELITNGKGNGVVSEIQSIALQSGLLNALGSSKVMTSIGISGADYAAGKSRAESNMENLASAQYMAQMLPYIQMTMRAVLYAFFPFVFITILLPGGLKVLAQYAQTLIWIELWSPTAAIVNMFVNMQVKSTIGEEYNKQGLTLISSMDMLSEANTIAGVGAMLYLSIPALTWLILKGSGQMLGNLTTGISGRFSKNLDSKSVAQDMGELEKQKEVNNRRNSAGMAALSYGEMMHYESTLKGAQEAGSMVAGMKAGGAQAVANTAEMDNLTKHMTAQRKMENFGIDGAASIASADSARSMATTQRELQNLGIMKGDGTLDGNALSKYAGSDAAIKSMQSISGNQQYQQFLQDKGLDNNMDSMRKFSQHRGNIEGIKANSSANIEEKIQKGTGQGTPSGNKEFSDTKSRKELVDYNTEKNVQGQLNDADRSKQNAIKQIYDNSKTKEEFKNKYEQAVKSGKIEGEKSFTSTQAQGLYQQFNDQEKRKNSEAFELGTKANLTESQIKEMGGNLDDASKRMGLANARAALVAMKGQEFADKYYNWNEDGSLKGQRDVTQNKTTEQLNKRTGSVDDSISRVSKADAFEKEQSIVTTETKEKSFNAKDYGITKGQEEVGEQYQNTRQQNETSKAAMKELTKSENIQHLYNSSIEHSMDNDKDVQKWRNIKDNAKWHSNQSIEAAEKGLAERENTYRVANAIAIADTVPLTEAGVNVLKQGLKGTGAEKEFNDILKAANMEKGNFDSFSNQELYNEVRYLNGGKSILTNDLSGNTVNTMNTNVLNNITQHSTSRSLGHSMDVRTNASGFVERNVMKGNLSEIHAWMIGGTTSIAKNAVIGAGLRNLGRANSKKKD